MRLRDHVDVYAASLAASGAVKVAPDAQHLFTLRNGQRSWFFVDHGEMLCQPETNVPFLMAMQGLVRATAGSRSPVLINVDSKSSPQLTGALAATMGARQIAVNSSVTQKLERGTNARVRLPRDLSAEDAFIIVDDVFTVGGRTAIDVAETVRPHVAARVGRVPMHIAVGLLRGDAQCAGEDLRPHDMQVDWLITLADLVRQSDLDLPAEAQAEFEI